MSKAAQRQVSAYAKGRDDAKKGRDFLPCNTSMVALYALGYENPHVPYKLHNFIGTDQLDEAMAYEGLG